MFAVVDDVVVDDIIIIVGFTQSQPREGYSCIDSNGYCGIVSCTCYTICYDNSSQIQSNWTGRVYGYRRMYIYSYISIPIYTCTFHVHRDIIDE